MNAVHWHRMPHAANLTGTVTLPPLQERHPNRRRASQTHTVSWYTSCKRHISKRQRFADRLSGSLEIAQASLAKARRHRYLAAMTNFALATSCQSATSAPQTMTLTCAATLTKTLVRHCASVCLFTNRVQCDDVSTDAGLPRTRVSTRAAHSGALRPRPGEYA